MSSTLESTDPNLGSLKGLLVCIDSGGNIRFSVLSREYHISSVIFDTIVGIIIIIVMPTQSASVVTML
jgi:hypothetical protein